MEGSSTTPLKVICRRLTTMTSSTPSTPNSEISDLVERDTRFHDSLQQQIHDYERHQSPSMLPIPALAQRVEETVSRLTTEQQEAMRNMYRAYDIRKTAKC